MKRKVGFIILLICTFSILSALNTQTTTVTTTQTKSKSKVKKYKPYCYKFYAGGGAQFFLEKATHKATFTESGSEYSKIESASMENFFKNRHSIKIGVERRKINKTSNAGIGFGFEYEHLNTIAKLPIYKFLLGKKLYIDSFNPYIKYGWQRKHFFYGFRNALVQKYNFTNIAAQDSVLASEVLALTKLDLTLSNGHYTYPNTIGLNNFVNLTSLKISAGLSNLNISKLTKLTNVEVKFLKCKTLDLSNQTNLKKLKAEAIFYMENLNINQCANLEEVYIMGCNGNNNSLGFDFSQNTKLKKATLMHFNNPDTVVFSNNPNIKEIVIDSAGLHSINIDECINLEKLIISPSDIQNLKLKYNTKLKYIDLRGNDDLNSTIVWQLPLPSNVTIFKDNQNRLVLEY